MDLLHSYFFDPMIETDPYYNLDLISASRLGVVKCLRDNLELPKASQEALDFGKQFHQAVLEPEKYSEALKTDPSYKKNEHKIKEMVKACMDNSFLCELLSAPGYVEHNHFFKEERYGIDCKIKMDKFIKILRSILDLKSTSAKTLKEFMESIVKFGYHRQGAFYLDGTDATKFILIGVSKTFPHKTFTVILPYDHELIEQGRKEYEELIDFYIQMPVKPDFKLLMS
jgi:hypothetical protein